MRSFAPDVVITRGYNAETLGRIAAWLTHVPHSVVWVHNHGDTEPRGAVRRMADRMLDRVTSAYFGVANAQTDYLVDDLEVLARTRSASFATASIPTVSSGPTSAAQYPISESANPTRSSE